MIRSLLVTTLIAAALPVQAQVFKCQEGGKTVFSDRPCGAGARVIDATPATGDGDQSSYNSSAERLKRNMEYLREKEQREDAVREQREIERVRDERIEKADKQRQSDRCNDIRARIDRYDAHMRERHYEETRQYYKAERTAAEQQLARECK